MLNLSEGLIELCKIKNYVVTGQQIDPTFVPCLHTHFKKYQPLIVGGRDYESANLVSQMGLPGGFSFDDAIEILINWSASKPNDKSLQKKDCLLIHMNTSFYAGNILHNKEIIINNLFTVTEKYPFSELLFMQAYNDRRLLVRDTLSSIVYLGDKLPFVNYNVIDLAKMALFYNSFNKDPDQNLAMLNGKFAISSSYHIALFCNFLGIPCYLHSTNDYYKQKKYGLGMNYSLEEFLKNPSLPSYQEKLTLRREWLRKLTMTFKNNEIKLSKNVVNISFPCETKPFLIDDLSNLEKERDRLWDELGRFRNSWEEQRRHIDDLEKERDRLWDELGRFQNSWEEQRRHIDNLEKERESLLIRIQSLEKALGIFGRD